MIKFFIFFSILFYSCKEANNRGCKTPLDSVPAEINQTMYADTLLDCYDYITELIRSSDFPFTGITPERVNIQIDNEDSESILLRLFFHTEGTGDIGWAKYYKKTNKLYNISANLISPEELSYSSKWAFKYNDCITKEIGFSEKDLNEKNSLPLYQAYEHATLQSLPLQYSYELITNDSGLLKLGARAIKQLQMDVTTECKLLKLPAIGNIKCFIAIATFESGQSAWYLTSMDTEGKLLDSLEIYNSIELEEGGSISKTFKISLGYSIEVNTTEIPENNNPKYEQKVVYQMDKLGNFKIKK